MNSYSVCIMNSNVMHSAKFKHFLICCSNVFNTCNSVGCLCTLYECVRACVCVTVTAHAYTLLLCVHAYVCVL